MRKKVILPFEDKPYSLMYHSTAFPLGIIQGNTTKNLIPWLCGKYINCWFAPAWINKFAYYVSDNWSVGDKIIIQQRVDLYPNEYEVTFNRDIIFLFRKMIDLGYYPNGTYNEEYIPGKRWFQKEYYGHDFILIGYNDIEHIFISVGYLQDKKFQRYTIPYNYMKMAISTLRNPKISYNFWKYNENAKYELNYDRLVIELSDYLNSTTSSKIYKQNRIWGIEAFDELGKYIVSASDDEKYIDHRYTRGIMEHKFFMNMRIEYLLNSKYLCDFEYLDYANRIFQLSESIHLLSMKYRMTGNKEISLHIYDIIKKIILKEKEYLPFVLENLKRKKDEYV